MLVAGEICSFCFESRVSANENKVKVTKTVSLPFGYIFFMNFHHVGFHYCFNDFSGHEATAFLFKGSKGE